MLIKSEEDLRKRGAHITTKEIYQQPELWLETFEVYSNIREEMDDFLAPLLNRTEPVRIVFTGAGTTAYIGETITPYLNEQYRETHVEFQSIPTTSIVSNPKEHLKPSITTLLVSFDRSGNSPESLATVQLAKELITNLYQLTMTCSADGELALAVEEDAENFLFLMPERSNDQGFAMTGAFTSMLLATLFAFDPRSFEEKEDITKELSIMGVEHLSQFAIVKEVVLEEFERVVYLGSGVFQGLSQEAQLKMLELTAGKIVATSESVLGFRHGSKSIINRETLIVLFFSNHPYRRQYEMDLLEELNADGLARNIIVIEDERKNRVPIIPDAYLAAPFSILAQLLALMSALKVKVKPDTPCPSGIMNCEVQDVIIYPFEP